MAHPNEDLVRRGYEAFGAGDMETLTSLMSDDVVHVIPGSNQFTGEHKGPGELTELYGELYRASGGTFSAEPLSVEAQGDDRVVSVHRATARRGDQSLDTQETLTFTVRDGKISRIESSFSPEDEAAEDAFWG